MLSNNKRILRIVAIVLLALTMVVTVVSGIGIYCAAFDTQSYPTLSALLPYQWLYQVFMVATLLGGLVGLWATVALIRGQVGSVRLALWVLLAVALTALAQVAASLALRGKSMPNDLRLYLAVITLVVFWFGRRGLSGATPPGQPGQPTQAAGAALIVCGAALGLAPLWAHIGHVEGSVNWASIADPGLALTSLGAFILGGILIARQTGASGPVGTSPHGGRPGPGSERSSVSSIVRTGA